MAVWCTTLPAAMHHLCGSSAPFRRWRCTIICGQVALLGRHMQVKEGHFKTVRIGTAIRISKKSFDEWLEKLEL